MKFLIVFSGSSGSVGGTQSWISNFQRNYGTSVTVTCLGCTKENLHSPAFKTSKKISSDIVLACDPLSLYWIRNNVTFFSLVIGFFHKDEWNLGNTSMLEKKVIETICDASLCMTFSGIRLPLLFANVSRAIVPLLPRNEFKSPIIFDQENKHILILARLEKFKGYPAQLPNISTWVSNVDSNIVIHVIGEGSLFSVLKALHMPNVKFWGMLTPFEIKQVAKCCKVGISSGISAIELTSIGLPVIVPREGSIDLDVTCVTSDGLFRSQDEAIDNSINFYDTLKKILFVDRINWTGLSVNASNAVVKEFNYDKLFAFKKHVKIAHETYRLNNLFVYIDYLVRIILDKIKIKKFGFIHRID